MDKQNDNIQDSVNATAKNAEATNIAPSPETSPSAETASATDDDPAVRVVIRQRETEDDMPLTKNVTLGKILGGDILNAQIIRKQIWVIVIAAMFIIVYISNRYKCQQDLIRIDKLTKDLKDAKYRALSSSSELTQQTRESKVLEKLRNDKDSTLHISSQPPYIINIPNTEEQ